jgi:hypothetical protein
MLTLRTYHFISIAHIPTTTSVKLTRHMIAPLILLNIGGAIAPGALLRELANRGETRCFVLLLVAFLAA